MKKLLVVLLTAVILISVLSVSFSTVAFASAGATKDEAYDQIKSIELTKLPDKLEYTLDDCDLYVGDVKLTEDVLENMSVEDFDQIIENFIDNGRININVDFSGAEVIGNYNEYYVTSVNNEDCSVSVADPFKFSELKKYEDIDTEDLTEEEFIAVLNEMLGLICREYTVDVTYEGFKTSYKIKLVNGYIHVFPGLDYESYEFVSYNNPSNRPYSISEDVYETVIYDEDGNEISVETVDVDTTGMTVTLKNKETGELVTFDEENASFDIEFYHFMNDSVPLRTGNYYAIGTIYTYDYGVVSFDYTITFEDEEDSEVSKSDGNNNNNDNNDTNNSTPDTAGKNTGKSSTADTPKSSSNSNGAIQTGDVVPATILLVLILGAVATMYFYRRKSAV